MVTQQEERDRPEKWAGAKSKKKAGSWRSAPGTNGWRAPQTLRRGERRRAWLGLLAQQRRKKRKRGLPPRKRAGGQNHRRSVRLELKAACNTCRRIGRTAFRRLPWAWRPGRHEKLCPRARSSGTPKAFPASSWRTSPTMPGSKRGVAATLSLNLKRHEAHFRVPWRLRFAPGERGALSVVHRYTPKGLEKPFHERSQRQENQSAHQPHFRPGRRNQSHD